MLKIRDNVDLKELEKFDLVLLKGRYPEETKYVLFVNHSGIRLSINKFSRVIKVTTSEKAIEKLYDLITAGLVEKVEE